MLNRGFSLFEMLLAIILTSVISISMVSFYSQFYAAIVRIYLQSSLEEATDHVLSSLMKDLRRAGFIANATNLRSKSAIEISDSGNCIVLRYDLTARGEWRYEPNDPQLSDVFSYRYHNNSLDYRTGIEHCGGSLPRWEKLFDPNKIKVSDFRAKQHPHYIEIRITVALKHHPLIQYQEVFYVKNYNQ